MRPRRPPVVLEPVVDDDRLKVWRHRGVNDRLVVCFSGIGTLKNGVKPDFVKTATELGRNHVLYIADPNRTWLNGPGLLERIVGLVEREVQETGAGKVVALGHSMGGFCALSIPGFTRIDAALAYSPQISVHPEIAPDEGRWLLFRKAIDGFVVPSALDRRVTNCDYHVIFGDTRREEPQRRQFRPQGNLHLFLLPGVRHDTADKVIAAGLGEAVLDAAFTRRPWRIRRLLRRAMGGFQVPVEE